MKRGPKVSPVKSAEAAPAALQPPNWLTDDGMVIWRQQVGHAQAQGLTDADVTLFGNYCCLAGEIARAWREGESVSVVRSMELRKLSELFGVGGPVSRVKPEEPKVNTNPFKRSR